MSTAGFALRYYSLGIRTGIALNYRDHMTHWKGTPLKDLPAQTLIEIIQYQSSRIRTLETKTKEISTLDERRLDLFG